MNKNQIYNPYLPLTEYIPDGEPHVFGERVYIYGSHDAPEGRVYCPGDYNVWSAPVHELWNWRNDGISYRKNQDPSNKDGRMQLWAPDVTAAPDGKYYLYYCLSFYPEIGVAVSDRPEGPFEFYGHVKYMESIHNGSALHEYMPFDPAVLCDNDGRVYLYFGFAPAAEKEMKAPKLSDDEIEALPEDKRDIFRLLRNIEFGEDAMVVELEKDMITMKGIPQRCIPGGHHTADSGFEEHGFFEASSIRKIKGKYYFVYSSHKSHELCYAVSRSPMSGFKYGGTIISNGDIGLNGRLNPVYPLGNNHGGIERIGESYYIFYHRQTAGTEFSRQGCAEKISISEDGSIRQTEITSCGLNQEPLYTSGSYPAAIACHITCPLSTSNINYDDPVMLEQTRIIEQQHMQFITDITDGSFIGYKYYDFMHVYQILIEVRGKFKGIATVMTDDDGEEIFGKSEIDIDSDKWMILGIQTSNVAGKKALYFKFNGNGRLDMKSIGFLTN